MTTNKKLLKAFMTGLAFPALFLPLAYTVLYLIEYPSMRIHSLQFLPMYIPILYGIANMIFIHMNEDVPVKKHNGGLWLTGACLGFIVAVIGVFILHVPTMIFGNLGQLEYLPLIALPIIYGVIFRFVVKYLNKVVGI